MTEPEETRETIQHLLKQIKSGKVIQLSFIGEGTEQPLITDLIRNYDVTVIFFKVKFHKHKMVHMVTYLFIWMGKNK